MRAIALAAVSTLALGAAACAPHVNYAARTKLDCPATQGELTRTSVAADGQSCLYKAGDVDVTLQLTPLSGGDAYATLKGVETSLVGAADAKAANAGDKGADAADKTEKPATASAASSDAAGKAAREASADAGHSTVHADVDWNSDDKDGVQVDKSAKNGDDHAHVSLPGLHIDADDNNAKVDVAGIHIDANDDHQTVHIVRDVRMQGEAFSREKRGLRATFIAKREGLPGGYEFVGYEASGPKTGPLTVAIVKSHDDIDNGNRLYHDIQRLVRRNGGA